MPTATTTPLLSKKKHKLCFKGHFLMFSVHSCASLEDGLYSNPDDCQGMFWCHHSVQFRLSCPYGQFFDAETGTCHFYAQFK